MAADSMSVRRNMPRHMTAFAGQRTIGAGKMAAEPGDLGSQTQNTTASGFSSSSDLRRLWLTAEVMNAD
jgi:hypothetical protein